MGFRIHLLCFLFCIREYIAEGKAKRKFQKAAVNLTLQVNISARARETISRRLQSTFVNYEEFKPTWSKASARRDSVASAFATFEGAAPRLPDAGVNIQSAREMTRTSSGSRQSVHRVVSKSSGCAPPIDLRDRLPRDLFEGARRLVFSMLERDCYSRFKARQRSGATPPNSVAMLSFELDAPGLPKRKYPNIPESTLSIPEQGSFKINA